MLVPLNLAVRVTELCCGNGEFAECLLLARPNASIRALDGDKRMLDAARARLLAYQERATVEYFDLAATNRTVFNSLSDIIVSCLAVHHLSDEEKKKLFRDIWCGLKPGGELILSDIFRPSTGLGWDIAGWAWDEIVRAQSLTKLENLKAFEKFTEHNWNSFTDHELDPIDKPSTLWEQMCWLHDVGFKDIEVHWIKAAHFILSARRPGPAWPKSSVDVYALRSPIRPD